MRQYRGSVDRELLEIPAGTRDVADEPPEHTAARELEEEVGVCALTIEHIGSMLNTPGFCDERTELYLATGLEACETNRHGPEEENITVVEIELDDVDSMVRDNVLIDGQTILGLLLARDVLAKRSGA